MKIRIPIPALAVLSLLLPLSCNPEIPEDNTAAITPRTTELEAGGGSIFVSVTAQAGWSIGIETSDNGDWARIDPSAGVGSKGDVRLHYEPNEGQEPRTVTLVLKPVKGAEARASLVQKSMFYAGGDSYGEDVASPKWLDLPATVAGDGLDFFAHDMKGGAYVNQSVSGVRNWSFYWDYKAHVSLWVAYPLNNNLKGSGSRSDQWGYDPLLPQDIQQSITSRFGLTYRYYSDPLYDRGHQIPSADRYLPRSANISTFYSTNMTPQSNPFNSGIWASLEGAVRGYAGKADTLYVVTGCIVDNTQTYVQDVVGHQIAVPTAYFKALLFSGTSTYATQGYMAAGFLLPHDDGIANMSYLNYIRSIDQLEQETGIDFFPNLAALVGKDKAEALEAAEPSKWWK